MWDGIRIKMKVRMKIGAPRAMNVWIQIEVLVRTSEL
jgi:hypothetical protein